MTDACVVLGRIGAGSFLGGEMPLDEAAARQGIEHELGSRLGMDTLEAALGIVKIAIAKKCRLPYVASPWSEVTIRETSRWSRWAERDRSRQWR